jgi:hypothetical protein
LLLMVLTCCAVWVLGQTQQAPQQQFAAGNVTPNQIIGAVTNISPSLVNAQGVQGQGVPPILIYAATTPTTPIGSTNILVSAPAGLYRVLVYYVVTTAGTVGTGITVNVTYTDAQQAQTNSSVTSSGLVQGQFASGLLLVQQQAAGNIAYTITETGSFTIHPVLALKICLERLN